MHTAEMDRMQTLALESDQVASTNVVLEKELEKARAHFNEQSDLLLKQSQKLDSLSHNLEKLQHEKQMAKEETQNLQLELGDARDLAHEKEATFEQMRRENTQYAQDELKMMDEAEKLQERLKQMEPVRDQLEEKTVLVDQLNKSNAALEEKLKYAPRLFCFAVVLWCCCVVLAVMVGVFEIALPVV